MSEWAWEPSVEELQILTQIASSFREVWREARPPFPAAFAGDIQDIFVLDYMDYEGISYPKGLSVEHAALLCGEVLRRSTDLGWRITYRGNWLLARPAGVEPGYAVCPSSRLHEIECSGQTLDRYITFVQRAAIEYACVVQTKDIRGVQAFFRPPLSEYRLTTARAQLTRIHGQAT